MGPTKSELQQILDSITEGEWLNPNITSWDEDGRIVYTLLATKPDSGELYYYEPDSGQFELIKMPGR